MMAYWKNKGGIIEASCRQCVPGCGKSALDGHFGVFEHLLRLLVDAGFSYQNAAELVKILLSEDVDELKGTYYHLFKPDRSYKFVTSATGLNKYYFLKVEGDGICGKVYTRHDEGKFFPFSELTCKKIYLETEADNISNQEEHTVPDTIDQSEESYSSLISPLSSEGGFDFSKYSKLFEGQVLEEEITIDPSFPPMILMSDFPFDHDSDGSAITRFSEHSKDSYQKRRLDKDKIRLTKHNKKIKEARNDEDVKKKKFLVYTVVLFKIRLIEKITVHLNVLLMPYSKITYAKEIMNFYIKV